VGGGTGYSGTDLFANSAALRGEAVVNLETVVEPDVAEK
jgi:hypothetical protein